MGATRASLVIALVALVVFDIAEVPPCARRGQQLTVMRTLQTTGPEELVTFDAAESSYTGKAPTLRQLTPELERRGAGAGGSVLRGREPDRGGARDGLRRIAPLLAGELGAYRHLAVEWRAAPSTPCTARGALCIC